MVKEKKKVEWTSVSVYQVTDRLANKLADVLGKEMGLPGPFPKYRAIHVALQEALARRKEL